MTVNHASYVDHLVNGQQASNGHHVVQLRMLTPCPREETPLTRMTMKKHMHGFLISMHGFLFSNFYRYKAWLAAEALLKTSAAAKQILNFSVCPDSVDVIG